MKNKNHPAAEPKLSMSLMAFQAAHAKPTANSRKIAASLVVPVSVYLGAVHMPCAPIGPTVERFLCRPDARHAPHIESEGPWWSLGTSTSAAVSSAAATSTIAHPYSS
jgi:hypothetical protein